MGEPEIGLFFVGKLHPDIIPRDRHWLAKCKCVRVKK
jgi:hypothetical protein